MVREPFVGATVAAESTGGPAISFDGPQPGFASAIGLIGMREPDICAGRGCAAAK
jgi:hypothetical protein